jgi:hypothetical protein
MANELPPVPHREPLTDTNGATTPIWAKWFETVRQRIRSGSSGGGGAVDSVNSQTGVVVLDKTDIGLGSVDNTADSAKPVSVAQATAIAAVQSDVDAHEANTSNPHGVTKAQIGLGSVDNTADSAKPVSTAQQTALDLKANIASPTFTGTPAAPTPATADNSTQVATTAFVKAQSYVTATTAPVTSVAGKTGAVTLVKADVGLSNVDNTADSVKSVASAATATTAGSFSGSLSGDVTGTQTATVVSTVGGSSAFNVNAATVLANNSTNLSTGSTIVKRDSGGVTNLKGVALDGATSGRITLTPAATTTAHTLTLPSAQGAASTYLKNDGAGALSWGTVSSGVNLILNPTAEVDTSNITTYKGTASATPSTSSGGSPSITLTRTTTNPIYSAGSFLYTKPASNCQGEGVNFACAAIELGSRTKMFDLSFDYMVASGTFTAGTSTTDSDVTLWLYQSNGSTSSIRQLINYRLLASSSTVSSPFRGQIQLDYDTTTANVLFHCAASHSTAFALRIDGLTFEPSKYVYGSPMSDPLGYTPIYAGFGTVTAVNSGIQWARFGKFIKIWGEFLAGTTTATTASIGLPSGLVMDLPVSGGNYTTIGRMVTNNATANVSKDWVLLGTSGDTAIKLGLPEYVFANNGLSPLNGNNISTGQACSIDVMVPILGWSSGVQMSDVSSGRLITARLTKNGTQATAAGDNKLTSFTQTLDRMNGWDSTNNRYVFAEAGDYDIGAMIHQTSAAAQVVAPAYRYNGGASVYMGAGASAVDTRGQGSDIISAKAGEYVEFYVFSGGTASIQTDTYFYIAKRQSPQTMSLTETVMCSYSNTAGTSIPYNTTMVAPFATKDYDPHGAYSSGVFTAPYNSKYRFTQYNTLASTSASAPYAVIAMIYKNGALYRRIGFGASTATDVHTVWGSTTVQLNAGETASFYIYQSVSAAGTTLTTGTGENWMTIEMVK